MAAALDNNSFIIKSRHQSIFWCRQRLILHNYEMLYLLHKMLSSQQKHLKKKKKLTMESLFLPLSSHYVFLTLLISIVVVVVVVFKLVFSILSHI